MATYDLGTARGRIVVDFEDKATQPAERAAASVTSSLRGAAQRLGGSMQQMTNNFVSGFNDANAASSSFSGVLGTIGGRARTALQPVITTVGNFVSGFNDSQAAASSFSGFMGTLGGRARTALQPAINTVGNFISGWNDTTAAASSFTGVMGTIGGKARSVLNPAINAVGDFISGFRDSSAAASSFTGVMGTVGGRVRSAWDSMGSSVQSFAQTAREKISQLGERVKNVARDMGEALKGAFQGAALIGVAAMGALAVSVARTGVSYNSLVQTSSAAFKTILGSAEAAEEMMDKIAEFGQTSPFPRQAFISATQQMLGFGFAAEDVIPILATINDAVAAMGGGAEEIARFSDIFSRIQSQGRITGEEINRMSELGVNGLQMLADAAGITANEMREEISKGAIDAEFAIAALTDGMNESFAGASENVKNTFPGAIDRVKGAWRDFSSAIVDPFVSKDGGGLGVTWANTLADLIRKLIPPVEEFASSLTSKLAPTLETMSENSAAWIDSLDFSVPTEGIEGLSTLLLPLAGMVLGFIGPLMANLPVIGPLFAGLTGPVGLIGGLLATVIANSEGLRDAFGELVAVGGEIFGELVDAVIPLLPSIQDLASVIGDVLGDVIIASLPILESLADIIIALLPAVEALTPVITWLVENALAPLITALVDFAGAPIGAIADLLQGDLAGAVDSMSAPLADLADSLGIELPLAMTDFEAATDHMKTSMDLVGDAVGALVEGDFDSLLSISQQWVDNMSEWTGIDYDAMFAGLQGWLQDLGIDFEGMGETATTIWENLQNGFATVQEVWDTIVSTVSDTITNFITWLQETWNGVIEFFTTLFEPLYPIFDSLGTLIDEVWRFITTLVQVAVHQIGNFVKTMGDNISAVWTAIVDFLTPIVTNIWNFIRDTFNNIKKAVSNSVNAVKTVITTVWNTIWGFIQPIVERIYNAIKGPFDRARTAVTNAVKGLYNGVKTWITNAVNVVTGLKDRILGALSGAGNWLVSAGKNVIQGFIDGITSMIDSVASTLGGITDNLANWKGPEWKDKIILEPVGELVMDGFVNGLQQGANEVESMLRGLTEKIPTMMSVGITQNGRGISDTAIAAYTGAVTATATREDRERGGDNYTIGDITISLEDLESIKTLEDFLDMLRVYKRQG